MPYALPALPFLWMDVFIRILASGVNYFQWRMVVPSLLFSLIWIAMMVFVTRSLRPLAGRILYGVFFLAFFAVFFTNCIYYSYTGFFFSFNLVSMAGEGSAYIWNTVKNASPVIYVVSVLILASAVLALVKFPRREKNDFRGMLAVLGFFILLHTLTPFLYGRAYDTLRWDAWRNPRNVYNNFNDSNKNIKVCGLYEYAFRDLYKVLFSVKQEKTKEEEELLKDSFSEIIEHRENEYTGLFAGKNVIFLQLEGMDNWLITPEDTPNLYKLMGESFNFTEHYSYYTGGGSTFNSELAVNTGFITPVTYYQNPYSFTQNLYPYSLPNLFKNIGYRVASFHMNTGEYYSRKLNHLNWGYDAYYGLRDIGGYKDAGYELDRELILNETFYDALFCGEEPFLHYIITYTPHTPFSSESEKGQLLVKEKYGEDVPPLTEEDYARLYAGETDYMVGLMLEALEENGLLENTVIVAFADHYLYTLNDKTILDQYKQTENNLINQTPFFIWSQGLTPTEFSKVNSQLDILPTVANLFGLEHSDEVFIGNDILSPDYAGYVFFSDYSWYDGKVYVENGEVVLGETPDTEYLIEMSALISQLILRNDLIQKYDYFRELQTQTQ